ncbi:MAG TPA: hypothetical protein PKY12_05675 [Catalimonadaceae bacterium]|nr:hypothetical protein [Catalimonadaceae bacterium]
MTQPFVGGPSANGLTPANRILLAGAADTLSQRRDFWPQILQEYPDEMYMTNGILSDVVGSKSYIGTGVDTLNVFHTQQPSLLTTVTVSAIDSGGTGSTAAIITIVPNTFGSTPLYTNYAVKEQVFQIERNQEYIYVESVDLPITTGASTHKITVRSTNGNAVVDVLQDGDVLLPQTMVTDQTAAFTKAGYVTSWSRFGVEFQPIKTETGSIPIGAYNQTYEFDTNPGGPGSRILAPKFTAQTMMRNLFNIATAALTGSGEQITTTAGETLQLTMGLTTCTETFGLSTGFGVGSFQQSDWNLTNDMLLIAGAGTDRKVYAGTGWLQSVNQNITSMFQNGAIQYIAGAQWNQGTYNDLKTNNLGRYTIGSSQYTFVNASEWDHKEIYSPATANATGQYVNSDAYWTNCFEIIPNKTYKLQKGLSADPNMVEAPMFRILQTRQPNTMNGVNTLTNVIYQDPANNDAMTYNMVIFQQIAAQLMLANKTLFGSAITA